MDPLKQQSPDARHQMPSDDDQPVQMLNRSQRRKTVEFDVADTDKTAAAADGPAAAAKSAPTMLSARWKASVPLVQLPSYADVAHLCLSAATGDGSGPAPTKTLAEYQAEYDKLLSEIVAIDRAWSGARSPFGAAVSPAGSLSSNNSLWKDRTESLCAANFYGSQSPSVRAGWSSRRFFSNALIKSEWFLTAGVLLIEALERSAVEDDIKEKCMTDVATANERMREVLLLLEVVKRTYPDVRLLRRWIGDPTCPLFVASKDHDPDEQSCGCVEGLGLV